MSIPKQWSNFLCSRQAYNEIGQPPKKIDSEIGM